MDQVLARLKPSDLGTYPNPERAPIKLNRKIPYVDAFGVELAAESSDRILVTADFDLKPAIKDVKVEFLPRK